MVKKILDQNNLINREIINSYDLDYIFSNKPINRVKNEPNKQGKVKQITKNQFLFN